LANFGTLKVQVLRLLGNHRQVTSNDIGAIIQEENREILDNYDWSARKAEGTIITVSTVTTGTVTATQSSPFVSGVSTAFTSNYVGRFIRIGSEDHYTEISSVTSGGRLDLKNNWPTDSASGLSYTIFKNVFQLESNCEKIISFARDSKIIERSRGFLDGIDPDRTETDSYPAIYSYRERTAANRLQVELWPVPISKKLLRYQYLKTGDLNLDADIPLYDSSTLKWKAGVTGAFFMLAKTNDATWQNLAIAYRGMYKQALESAKAGDLHKFSSEKIQKSRDTVNLANDYWMVDHDFIGV